jgi:hypothetical protein
MGTDLVARASLALGLTNAMLAQIMGYSTRTIERRNRSGDWIGEFHLHPLARAVYPRDPKLAAELAKAGGTTLEKLGCVPAASPVAAPPPPQLPAPTLDHLGDSIVCAAAETMNVPPPAVRPALIAAFARARQLGLSLEAAENGVRGRSAAGQAEASTEKPSKVRK